MSKRLATNKNGTIDADRYNRISAVAGRMQERIVKGIAGDGGFSAKASKASYGNSKG